MQPSPSICLLSHNDCRFPPPHLCFHSLFLGTMLKTASIPQGSPRVSLCHHMLRGQDPLGDLENTLAKPPHPQPLGSPLGRQKQREIRAIGLDSCAIQATKASTSLSQWGQDERSSTCTLGTGKLKRPREKEALDLRGRSQPRCVVLQLCPRQPLLHLLKEQRLGS